jgi:D-glycero-D-manno-heptose 1,7-bisphosphate phosphatase
VSANPEKRRAIFLDRDGVINPLTGFRDGKPRAPDTLADFRYLPGVKESAQRLRDAGFLLVIVTNQPDVARGWQKRTVVEAMNAKAKADLAIDGVEVCYHDEPDRCECRKPNPGMLLRAAKQWNIDLPRSFMIGDRESDVKAGCAAGCSAILVTGGRKGAHDSSDSDNTVPRGPVPSGMVSYFARDLADAANWILAHRSTVKE